MFPYAILGPHSNAALLWGWYGEVLFADLSATLMA
jgi:hypothetical protein